MSITKAILGFSPNSTAGHPTVTGPKPARLLQLRNLHRLNSKRLRAVAENSDAAYSCGAPSHQRQQICRELWVEVFEDVVPLHGAGLVAGANVEGAECVLAENVPRSQLDKLA